MEHLVEHMRASFHSLHEPMCMICMKHCRSFESLREHLIGPLPKIECAKLFKSQGCSFCLNIFGSQQALRIHRSSCQVQATQGLISSMSSLSFQNQAEIDPRMQCLRAVALSCKMVGGGSDGSPDICAKVCIIDEEENIVFHTYIRPQITVTNYRYETSGIRPEHLRDAVPLKQAQRKIQDFLCNGEATWKIRSRDTGARILVGHGLDQYLESLGIEYPEFLYSYEIQAGVQEPYEDCVAVMRLYVRLKSLRHSGDRALGSEEAQVRNNFATWKQRELERMSPMALLEISTSDYYCWCLDS